MKVTLNILDPFFKRFTLQYYINLFSLMGQTDAIKTYCDERDMSKRLKFWFKVEEYESFLFELGPNLVANLQTFFNLIDLGEET